MSNGKQWTLMFYFGSDNPLAAVLVSQLRAIKDAGFQNNTKVIVQFDPAERGVPTRLFDVNIKRKLDSLGRGENGTVVGDGNDPFVHRMIDDYIDPATIDGNAGPSSAAIKKALQTPDVVPASDSLKNFLGFCEENYGAHHYVLFLIGHGMVVANDKFLSDENPDTGISLTDLGTVLNDFSSRVRDKGQSLELVAMHSCSMSSIEVAYELQGTANFMMASQGMSFVGSWPYRQLLKKFFNAVGRASNGQSEMSADEIQALIESLYGISLYNETDFEVSGYSQDLCLTRLQRKNFYELNNALPTLVERLKDGLQDQSVINAIQLAHLKSQSFWQEEYTDLYDFCQCLSESVSGELKNACQEIINALTSDRTNRSVKLLVAADHSGWKYQYARGLSVYFPWCEPIGDSNQNVINNYEGYKITSSFETDKSWLSFLRLYFKNTMRQPSQNGRTRFDEAAIANDLAVFSALDKPTGAFDKTTGATGFDCSCPSIKNYPTKVVTVKGISRNIRVFSVTDGIFNSLFQ